MKTKKLYITPSIEEISIGVCDIIATSPTGDNVNIPLNPEIEDEGYGD